MHLDTTHEATYTLECLLLKISTKYDYGAIFSQFKLFSAVIQHFAASCRCHTVQFGAMSSIMRVSPPEPVEVGLMSLVVSNYTDDLIRGTEDLNKPTWMNFVNHVKCM